MAINETNVSFKQKLFSGIIWRALNVVFAFVFNALLVSQLGATASGSFFYLLNNLFFIILLLGIGLESGISFYNARKEISTSFLFSISIIWSVVGTVVFLVIIHFVSFGEFNLKDNQLFLAAYVLGSMLTTFFSSIYFTNHNSKVPNVTTTVVNVILILLLPKMPWINGQINFDTYTRLYLCSACISAVIMGILLLRQKLKFSFLVLRASIIKPLLLFSFHSLVLGLLFNLLKRSDFWMVNKWCNSNDAGNYFQASKVIQLLLLLPALASFSLYPLIVQTIKRNENNEMEDIAETKVMQLVGLYFLIALVLASGIIVFGYWVFPLLYGVTFNSLYFVTLFLMPGLVFFAATYPLSTYFSGKNQNITTILFLGIAIVCLVISNFILTPKYFIYGAAVSSSIANFIYFFLLLRKFLLQNKLSFNLKKFLVPFKMSAVFNGIIKT